MKQYLPRGTGRSTIFGGCLSGLIALASICGCVFFNTGVGRNLLQNIFPNRNPETLAQLLTYGFIGLISLFSVGVVILGYVRLAFRRKAHEGVMQATAQRLNWNYQPQPSSQFLPFLDAIKESRGTGRFEINNVSNVIGGAIDGAAVTVFDHHFTDRFGSTRRTYWETVYLVSSNQLNLPGFHTQKEGFLDSFFNDIAGRQDINFPHRPKFSGQYLLRGADENFIRQVFTDSILQFYEEQFPLETIGSGNFLCLFQPRDDNTPTTENEIQIWIQASIKLHSLFAVKRHN